MVAVENPGYVPSRAAFANAGAEIVGVPVDEQGMVVSQIPPSARVICVTPSHQFPLGVTMSPERRALLLEHARRWDAYVVEDDYDCEYRYDSRPLDALQTLAPGRVCYVGTFSKTMFSALRIGFAVVPETLIDRLLEFKKVADGFGAPGPQLALAEFITKGHLHRHVRTMQRVYAKRRALLLDGLQGRLGDRIHVLPSTAGLHFSLRLMGPVDWEQIWQRAGELDLAFELCSKYSMGDEASACVAIGFGLLVDEQIPEAVNRLVAILK